MASNRFNISRDVLAKFLPDNDTIRRFENLFQAVGEIDPVDLSLIFSLLEELSVSVSTASSGSVSVNDAVSVLTRLLDQIVSAPVYDPSRVSALESAIREILPASTRPPTEMPRSFPVDYLDFDKNQIVAPQVGRLSWNPADDTLDIQHSDGVTQQVGQEMFVRFLNSSGVNFPNGTCIGVNPATNLLTIYIADGTMSPLGIVGVTTQSIANGATGRATVFGRVHDIDTTGTPYGEVWTAGDLLYVSTTVAGGFTRAKPTAPNVSIPIGRVVTVNATTGIIFVRPAPEQQLYYGQFIKTTDQLPSAANTAQALTWSSTLIANGLSIGAPASRIVAANAGLYKFSVGLQLTSSSASVKNVWIWFRKNGVDVASSSLITSLDSGTAIRTPSRSMFFSLVAGDYIEVMFASDSTNMTVDNIAATAFAPAAPAAILTVNQEQQ